MDATPQTGKPPLLRRRAAWAALALLTGVLVWGAVPPRPRLLSGAPFSGNGLWVRHFWLERRQRQSDIERLAHLCEAHSIRYLYLHAGQPDDAGRLPKRDTAAARANVVRLHRAARDVKLLAWVGGPRSRFSLADAKARTRLVRETIAFVEAVGLDGVQWDIEPYLDADPHFLALLDETRSAARPEMLIGVAAPWLKPAWFPARRAGWSPTYYSKVAARCDQIAVMCYDTHIPLPRFYAWFVGWQTRAISKAVATPPARRLLIGLPTYDSVGIRHRACAENIATGLAGVMGATDAGEIKPALSGVAVFAEWSTDAGEWSAYDRLWLARGRAATATQERRGRRDAFSRRPR